MSETTSFPWMGSSLETVRPFSASGMTTYAMGVGGMLTDLSSFNPSSLTGLVSWYDATQITGIPSGGSVSAWTDLSASISHLSNPTASTQPLYFTSAQNGKSVVSFGGTHFLRNAFSSISQPVTMFYATRVDGAGATLNGMATLGPTFQGLAENSGLFFTNQGANNFLTASSSQSTFTLLCAIINGSSSTGYVNGSSNTTVHNPGTASLLSYSLGAVGASASWVGVMGEIAIYNRALTLSEVTSMFNYLGPKWGITIT